jgi:hypothetical protein
MEKLVLVIHYSYDPDDVVFLEYESLGAFKTYISNFVKSSTRFFDQIPEDEHHLHNDLKYLYFRNVLLHIIVLIPSIRWMNISKTIKQPL